MSALTRRNFVGLSAASALGVLCTGMLSSCTSQGNDDASNERVVIVLSPDSEPDDGFDPLFGWACGEALHVPLIQSTLLTVDAAYRFKYDLATRYEVSDDHLTWTFTLRDDAKFTNGQPVVAADVVFTVQGVLQSDESKVDLSALESVEALDPHTVVFHLTRPCNTLLNSLAYIGIVCRDSYNADTYGNHPIGSGPYRLAAWDRGKRIVLKANDAYYGTPPTMKKVVVSLLKEDDACSACFEGKADIAYTTPRLANQSITGFSLLDCSTIDCYGISLPTTAPGGTRPAPDGGLPLATGNAITQDVGVRRAINYALDRKSMLKKAIRGYGNAAYGPAEGLPWGSDDLRFDHDKNKATTYLDQAGWVVGADGFRLKNGVRAALDLYYLTNEIVKHPPAAALANNFATQMKEVGIDVTLHASSWLEMQDHAYSDLVLWETGNGSPAELYDLLSRSGVSNYPGYGTAQIDAYLDAADAALTSEEAYELWKKAQWDGTDGLAVQGAATWAWLADIDHIYFKRAILDVGIQYAHTRSGGWSLLNNVHTWVWNNA